MCFWGMNSASSARIGVALSGVLFCGSSTAASFGTSALHHAVAEKPVKSYVVL